MEDVLSKLSTWSPTFGWMQWSEANSENQGLDIFYFERYEIYGSSTSTDNRVSWSGYHVIDIYNAQLYVEIRKKKKFKILLMHFNKKKQKQKQKKLLMY